MRWQCQRRPHHMRGQKVHLLRPTPLTLLFSVRGLRGGSRESRAPFGVWRGTLTDGDSRPSEGGRKKRKKAAGLESSERKCVREREREARHDGGVAASVERRPALLKGCLKWRLEALSTASPIKETDCNGTPFPSFNGHGLPFRRAK